jgi:hypothetical protein
VRGNNGGGGGQDDGGEFLQVEVALIAVIEDNVPDEFVVGGDVVVDDYAVEPPSTELHPDVASDKGIRQGQWDLWVGKNGSCGGRVSPNGGWARDTR